MMNKIISISKHEDATLMYFLTYILIGIIHQKSNDKVKGIVLGIWRFQLQISIGYSLKDTIGEIGHA